MYITELFPLGPKAPGCITLQHNEAQDRIRLVFWTDEVPDWNPYISPDGIYVRRIIEIPAADVPDMPEFLLLEYAGIVAEILSDPNLARRWKPNDLARTARRALTVLDLRCGPEGYAEALRTKGRLGPWLNPPHADLSAEATHDY